jgi:hypothetical protein
VGAVVRLRETEQDEADETAEQHHADGLQRRGRTCVHDHTVRFAEALGVLRFDQESREGNHVTLRSRRCRKCRCLVNDPEYPLESDDRHNTGKCQRCRADAHDPRAMLNLGMITQEQYTRGMQRLRAAVRRA